MRFLFHTCKDKFSPFLIMNVKNKDSVNFPYPSESLDSESLYIRLAKAHAAGPYASVNQRYLGDSVPLLIDHNQ